MFEYAIKKARELIEDYNLHVLGATNSSRKCEKQFLWRCQDGLRLDIKVLYLPENLPPQAMRGTYIRTPSGYDILLLPNQPPELERYVLVKEIFHAIFDSEAFYNMDVLDHLDKTLFSEGSTPMPLSAVCEYATHAAAAEFLFPFKDRQAIVANAKATDVNVIAGKYEIPSAIVEHYLTASAMKFYELP